jgi:hypothetical protein
LSTELALVRLAWRITVLRSLSFIDLDQSGLQVVEPVMNGDANAAP